MNRYGLIEELSKKGYTKKDALIVINDVFMTIFEAMARGEEVDIRGFGNFEIREMQPRTCLNFSTGEMNHVPVHKLPRFVPCKALKDAVRTGLARL